MKKYISPTTEVVNVQARCSMLSASVTDWADAKPNNPSHNLWADEEEYSRIPKRHESVVIASLQPISVSWPIGVE